MTISRIVAFLLFVGAASSAIAVDTVADAPNFVSNLPLRASGGPLIAATVRLETSPLPDAPVLRVEPIAPAASLPDAQLAVIRAPEAWRNWAALALARYKTGDYEKAFAAVRQMRVAATARNEPLPLAADELYRKCRRASDALTLLE